MTCKTGWREATRSRVHDTDAEGRDSSSRYDLVISLLSKGPTAD
ncbi:hypothetical protein [Haladaptatus sp. DYF46]|nr:hypothetical protein [Haladaptatus sp. DYF46]